MHKTDTRLATIVAALASLGAGLIHLAVIPGHWQEWLPSGLFFTAIALFQLLWAGVVFHVPRAEVIGAGILANMGSVLLWGLSRVWGIPVGPNADVPEPVGVPDVLTVVLESIVVASAIWSLLPRKRTAVLATGSYRFALGSAAIVVALLAAPGMVAGLEQGHADHGSHDTGNGDSHRETETDSPTNSDREDRPPAPSGPPRSTSTPPESDSHTHG